MNFFHRSGYEQRQSLTALLAAAIGLLTCACGARASILTSSQPFGFDEAALKMSLSDQGASSSSSSSWGRNASQSLPIDSGDHSPIPLHLLRAHLPTGDTSSSGSSSSSSVGVSISLAVGALNASITIVEDATLGRLAEDHALALPDPPGTDLLRPPRAA